jgi:antibiotic biosynthesis monooxygenase (ABM) superfamily enzyme
MSFAVSLFLGNIVSVGLTGFLVPWVANRFGWWLRPAPGRNALQVHLLGAAAILVLYALMVGVFATQF